ncbi:MAG: LytTR family DNA-binding domain-containing protein [Pseudomonadota bacterium]
MPAIMKRLLGQAGTVAGLGFAFAWFGVYGSSDMSFLPRWAFWCATIAVGFAAAAFVVPWVFDDRFSDRPPALQIGVAAAIISVPVTMALLLIDGVLGGGLPAPAEWPAQYAYVFGVSLILTVCGYVIARLQDADEPAERTVAFMDRLPARFKTAQLFAVSAEDHYLRVHTDLGETLILMRLSDAIRELPAETGLQTHRSWWVAKSGVADVRRDNGKLVLMLKSGAAAPVSRTYAGAVREASLA